MATTITKTLLVALSLGAAMFASPAFADHSRDCDGPIVTAETYGDNDIGASMSGCGEAAIYADGDSGEIDASVEDHARLYVHDSDGSDSEFVLEDEAQVGSETVDGTTAILAVDDSRVANFTKGGSTSVGASGDSDTVIENDGGAVSVVNGGGSVSVFVDSLDN